EIVANEKPDSSAARARWTRSLGLRSSEESVKPISTIPPAFLSPASASFRVPLREDHHRQSTVAEGLALAICIGLLQGAKGGLISCSGGLLPHQLLLARLHVLAELSELILIEDLLCLLAHLVFFFLDVVFEVLLHAPELRAPLLVVVGHALELGHNHVDDMVLLVGFQGYLLGLGVVLQGRIEDFLLDRLTAAELLLDLPEQLLTGLHATFGRGFELREHLLHLLVVLFEQSHRVHRASPLSRAASISHPSPVMGIPVQRPGSLQRCWCVRAGYPGQHFAG